MPGLRSRIAVADDGITHIVDTRNVYNIITRCILVLYPKRVPWLPKSARFYTEATEDSVVTCIDCVVLDLQT